MNATELRVEAMKAAVAMGAQAWEVVGIAETIYRWLLAGDAPVRVDVSAGNQDGAAA